MRSVVAHIVSCILLAGISLMTSCREDEVIILAEYERLPLGDNSRSDYAGLYLLNEGNMGSNKCTLDFVDFDNGYYVRNLYAEKNPNVVKELGDVGNDVQIYGSKMYAVINCSHKVEVLDARSCQRLGQVDIPNCRYIAFDKGFAYESDDGVYFEIEKFEEFGKLSNRKVDEMESHRELAETTKKSEQDFALWKKRENVDEPTFPSPWGNGRPGWHIEDTAITEYYFGEQYDVHGGGLDLIFPHHEAEITQMEAVSGKSPMVKYWLHTGFLNVNGEKMSKSLHNFITIRELLKDWDADTFRFFVLSTHYRSPIDFSKDSLHQSEKSLEKIKKFYSAIDVEDSDVESDFEALKAAKKEFFGSMDDDFNTPKAIASLFVLINECKNVDLSDDDKAAIKSFLDDVSQILGIDFTLEETSAGSDDLFDLITDVRSELRAAKQYELSDKIRDELINLGYEISD